jgi:glutamate racemase
MATAIVFDSGVGGLSVFDCIAAALPDLRLLYVADNAYFPYGTKEEAALVARVRDLLAGLAERLHPDLVVIACNTASTVALPAVREALGVPIVGTVPAIKPAAQASVTRVIGLLGTPGTVRRQYTQALIDEFAPDCTVLRHGSADLVELAEQKLRGDSIAPTAVERALAGLFDQPGGERSDTVVSPAPIFRCSRPSLPPTRRGHCTGSTPAPPSRGASSHSSTALLRRPPQKRHRGIAPFLPRGTPRSRSCGRRCLCAVCRRSSL